MEFSAVTTAVGNLSTVMGTVLDTIAGNPLLMVLVAVPVVGAGCVVFKKLIKAARGQSLVSSKCLLLGCELNNLHPIFLKKVVKYECKIK